MFQVKNLTKTGEYPYEKYTFEYHGKFFTGTCSNTPIQVALLHGYRYQCDIYLNDQKLFTIYKRDSRESIGKFELYRHLRWYEKKYNKL